MRDYRPYVLPDGTEIPGRWYQNPERFVATEYGWRKLTEWARGNMQQCARFEETRLHYERPPKVRTVRYFHLGHEFHHKHGRGGGKRDDRLESLEWLCRTHHQETRILRRPVRA